MLPLNKLMSGLYRKYVYWDTISVGSILCSRGFSATLLVRHYLDVLKSHGYFMAFLQIKTLYGLVQIRVLSWIFCNCTAPLGSIQIPRFFLLLFCNSKALFGCVKISRLFRGFSAN